MKVFDGPQYLFDVEMRDIDGETVGIVDFIPEVPGVYGLMNKQRQEAVSGRAG